MHIDYLADHPELIPKLARHYFAEWGRFHPDEPIEDRTDRLAAACGRGGIPTVVVALNDDGELAGGAMLVENDMETRPDLTPWLAGVYVAPARRGHGHASALVARIEAEAAAAGVERLYLYTPNAMSLYARLGWAEDERCQYRGEEVAIMSKRLVATPARGAPRLTSASSPAPPPTPSAE